MNSPILRILGATVVAGALLQGCGDARQERLEGARRALAAVPDVEIVGTDPAGVLTLRSRATGATTTIDLGSRTAAAPAALAAGSPDAGPTPASGDAAAAVTALAPGDAAGTPAADTAAVVGTPATQDPASASAEPAGSAVGGATAASVAAASAGAPTVVRDPQGRVQVIQGSGFRIERAPGAGVPGARAAAATAGKAGAADHARRRMTVPVVCGAGESRALQGVEIDVPGAGIVAERGCTLTVANVRVRSGGWGLVVNPGASVRIDDSLVEGRTGALDLYPGGNLSAWATTFRGALGRPADAPQFVDRGGNAWE